MLRLCAMLLAVTCVVSCGRSSEPPVSVPAPAQPLNAVQTLDVASAATLLSIERASAGISNPLVFHPALQAAAQLHADDIAAMGALSHVGSDGSDLADRLERAGYAYGAAAENIASGWPDVPGVIEGWMASEGHRRNILDLRMTQFGLGRAEGGVWVLVLGQPRN